MDDSCDGHRRASVGVMIKSPTDGYGTDDEKKTSRRASLHGPTVRTRRHSCERNSRFKQLEQRRNSRRASSQGIDASIVARLSFVKTGADSDSDSSSSSLGSEDRRHYNTYGLSERRTGETVRSRRPSQKAKSKASKQGSDTEGSYGIECEVGNVPDAFGYESDALGCESDMEKSTSSKLARRRNSAQTIEKSVNLYDRVPNSKDAPMLGEYKREDSVEKPLVVTKEPEFEPKSPFRTSPLTISYAPPTEQALRDIGRIQLDVCELKDHKPKPEQMVAEKDAWGMLELNDEYSQPKSSSNMSYGPSLYDNFTSHEEVDKYKQRARRRDSLVDDCIDLDLEGMKKQVPLFTPAEGCLNASNFIVRCFTARLRTTGFTVLKHNRSRWSKSTHRVLFLRPDGITLSWRPTDEEMEKQKGTARQPLIDLRTCLEVRHAWTKDPTRENRRGTAVLRSRLSESHLASKSLSLIFKSRTLDITAFSNDQCKVMMEGFSALCYRLQLREWEDSSNTFSKPPNEDDWASTIYASTSVSMTNTSSTGFESRKIPSTPWGL